MTKETILNKISEQNNRDSWSLSNGMDYFDGNASSVFKAMDDYAKQECIHLLDFLNETLTLKDGDYWLDGELVAYPHETDIIYKLYLTYNLNNKQ